MSVVKEQQQESMLNEVENSVRNSTTTSTSMTFPSTTKESETTDARVNMSAPDQKSKKLLGLKALKGENKSRSIGKNKKKTTYEDMPESLVSLLLRELVLKHEKHAKTIVKTSKCQSILFESKCVMRSDGSGNVSDTQDFLKGEVSYVNDQKPSEKLTHGRQSPDDSDPNERISKVTTITTAIGKITGSEMTEELTMSNNNSSKILKRSPTNEKFERLLKIFSQESFNQEDRLSFKLNGSKKVEDSFQISPKKSAIPRDLIRALRNKFQQPTVSHSLKQNRSAEFDASNRNRQVVEKAATTKVNTSESSGTASSFLDNGSNVTGVQDDLVVGNGDTKEIIEARALLNKYLGASVILREMEHGGQSPKSSPTATTTSSAPLVNQVEKQRVQYDTQYLTNSRFARNQGAGAAAALQPPAGTVPRFEPKTAMDKKYLAWLQQGRKRSTEPQSAGHTMHGQLLKGDRGNRVELIKQKFENAGGAASASTTSSSSKGNTVKTVWSLQRPNSWAQLTIGQTGAAAASRSLQPGRRKTVPHEVRVPNEQIAQNRLRAAGPLVGGVASGGRSGLVKVSEDMDEVEDTFERLYDEAYPETSSRRTAS